MKTRFIDYILMKCKHTQFETKGCNRGITVVLIRYHFFFNGLEGKLPLRDVAEDCRDDIDNSIGNRVDECVRTTVRHYLQQHIEELNEQVSEQDKGSSRHHIPEKLNPAMQVRFREHDMTRQRKANGETDAESHNIGSYRGCDIIMAEYTHRFVREDKSETDRI